MLQSQRKVTQPNQLKTLSIEGAVTVERDVATLHAVMIERIGERHASACRYKNDVPEGSRHSARLTHFLTREVQVCILVLWHKLAGDHDRVAVNAAVFEVGLKLFFGRCPSALADQDADFDPV